MAAARSVRRRGERRRGHALAGQQPHLAGRGVARRPAAAGDRLRLVLSSSERCGVPLHRPALAPEDALQDCRAGDALLAGARDCGILPRTPQRNRRLAQDERIRRLRLHAAAHRARADGGRRPDAQLCRKLRAEAGDGLVPDLFGAARGHARGDAGDRSSGRTIVGRKDRTAPRSGKLRSG